MVVRFWGSLFMVFLLAGCAGAPAGPASLGGPQVEVPRYPPVPEGSVRFLVIGDAGMGNEAQAAVAQAMDGVCRAKGCQFVLVNGDNIYNVGVTSATDPQFEDKFETPYRDVELPFYLVLGNHDNGDGSGSKPEVGDFQVAYAQRTDRLSDKWHMPARYYSLNFGDVQIFGLDSGPQEISQAQLPIYLPNSRGDVEAKWLAAEVAKSTAKWKFAFAHHPYVSNGPHRNAGFFDGVPLRGFPYQRMLEASVCDRMQVFFAGHDHNLQWLKPVDSCGRTQFIVSGAGGAAIYKQGAGMPNAAEFEDYEHHGFFWVDVTGDTFTGVAYSDAGEVLFEKSFKA